MTSIHDVTIGDNLQIVRSVSNVAAGEYVTKAWLTIKRRIVDADSAAKIQKIITTTEIADGLIVNPSPLDGSARVIFNIAPEDWTAILAGTLYRYDVQVKTSGDAIYTVDSGTFRASPQVTQSDS